MNSADSTESQAPRPANLKHAVWLPLTVFAGLAFAVAAGIYSSRMMMLSSTADAKQLAAAAAGTSLDVAVEVTALPSPDVLDALLLDKQGSDYRRTAEVVHIHVPAAVPVVMGRYRDLQPGAVLQVSALSQGADKRRLEAKQLVVLTGYVQVH